MKIQLNLLQLFRGLAAIMVLFYHTSSLTNFYYPNQHWIFNIFRISWFGVDFFFVLSGFIITYIHLADIKRQKNVKTFLWKRFVRVYPMLWIISLIYLFATLVTKVHTVSDVFSIYMLDSFTLWPTLNPLVGVSWSLTYEVIFYLIFAVCILLGWKATKWIAGVWLLIVLAFNLFHLPLFTHLVSGYVIEFLMGGLIGYLFQRMMTENKIFISHPGLLLTAGCFLLIAAWSYCYTIPSETYGYFASRIAFGLASALIIFGGVVLETKIAPRVPSFFLLFGDASYVIYLIHSLVLATFFKTAVHYLHNQHSVSFIFFLGLIAASMSVIIGVVLHKVIEKPTLRYANRLLFPLKNKEVKYENGVLAKSSL